VTPRKVAALIAKGRPVGHPEVRLWMRAAGARMGEAGRAVEAIPD
jgi:hypothetical protein